MYIFYIVNIFCALLIHSSKEGRPSYIPRRRVAAHRFWGKAKDQKQMLLVLLGGDKRDRTADLLNAILSPLGFSGKRGRKRPIFLGFLPPPRAKKYLIPLRFHFFGGPFGGVTWQRVFPSAKGRGSGKSRIAWGFVRRPGERSDGNPRYFPSGAAPRRQAGGRGELKQELPLFCAGRRRGKNRGHTGGKRRVSPLFSRK